MGFASGGLISSPQDYIPNYPVLPPDHLLSPETVPLIADILSALPRDYSSEKLRGFLFTQIEVLERARLRRLLNTESSLAVALHSFSRPCGYVLVTGHVTRVCLYYANYFYSASLRQHKSTAQLQKTRLWSAWPYSLTVWSSPLHQAYALLRLLVPTTHRSRGWRLACTNLKISLQVFKLPLNRTSSHVLVRSVEPLPDVVTDALLPPLPPH